MAPLNPRAEMTSKQGKVLRDKSDGASQGESTHRGSVVAKDGPVKPSSSFTCWGNQVPSSLECSRDQMCQDCQQQDREAHEQAKTSKVGQRE